MTVQSRSRKRDGARPRFAALVAAATLGGAALLLTGTVARPAAAQTPAGAALVWQDINVGERVPISRALFDGSGYWLFTTDGHTIFVPFTDQDLYVLRFARSYDGQMYLENDGDGPILYLPESGRLENAAVPDSYWYPFPADYAYTGPVYIGIAPSWNDYISMSWYPNMCYYGGFWAYHPWYSYSAPFPQIAGTYCVIGNRPYHGWHSYSVYCNEHPRRPAFLVRPRYSGHVGVPVSPRPLIRPDYVPGQGHIGTLTSRPTAREGIIARPPMNRQSSSSRPSWLSSHAETGNGSSGGASSGTHPAFGIRGGPVSVGVPRIPATALPSGGAAPRPNAGAIGAIGERPRWVNPSIRWEGQPASPTARQIPGESNAGPGRIPIVRPNYNYEGIPMSRPSYGQSPAPGIRPSYSAPGAMPPPPSRPTFTAPTERAPVVIQQAPAMQAPVVRQNFGGGERAPMMPSRPTASHDSGNGGNGGNNGSSGNGGRSSH